MNVKKLKELREVLDSLRKVKDLFSVLGKYRTRLHSERLRALTGFASEGEGIIPEFASLIAEFDKIIDWKSLGKGPEADQVPEPNGGVDQEYDDAKELIKDLLAMLEGEIMHWQEIFNDKTIKFVHKKYRFEIEISDSHIKKMKPKELEFTSKRDGYQRFHTKEIRSLHGV